MGVLALSMMLTSRNLVFVNLPGNVFPLSTLILLHLGPMISAPEVFCPKTVSQ